MSGGTNTLRAGSPLLDTALDYAARGWAVFPLHSVDATGRCTCGKTECDSPDKHPHITNGLKGASTDIDQIRRWWEHWPEANIGIRTGSVSGIFALDMDSQEAVEQLRVASKTIPTDACRQKTGRGWQVFFTLPNFCVKNSAGKIAPQIDVRGEGGYVVAPPSRHANGTTYHWLSDAHPGPAPAWLLDDIAEMQQSQSGPPAQASPGRLSRQPYLAAALRGERGRVASAPPSTRNDTLNRAAYSLGQLEHAGLLRAEAEPEIVAAAITAGLREAEARATFASGWTAGTENPRAISGNAQAMATPGNESNTIPTPLPSFPRTDSGNAELFAHLNGERVRYDHQRQRWLIWRGHRFASDSDGHICRLAKQTARERYLRAVDITDEQERRREADFAIKSESRARLDAILTLAEAEHPLSSAGDRWDEAPWLLGVANGVVDLRTGRLRPGRPEDAITLAAGTDFDPKAVAPRFERFLSEIFEDNQELIAFVRRAVGYSLTGLTSEQCFFLFYGRGSNGKSVLLNVLLALFGDYGYAAPFSTFEYSRGSSIPNDVAQLAGRRLVVASETNEGARLDEARIKQLTGGEAQTARFLNHEYFTFTPRAAIFLAVNHRPQVKDDSRGFWRRVRLVPFKHEFSATDIDLHLQEKLLAELPGILSWAIQGCLEWQKEGLNPPAEVASAVADYQADSDPLAEFLAECCLEGPGVSVRASTVYERYRDWAETHKLPERELLSSRIFGERLSARFEKKRSGAGVTYFGLAVAS